MATYLITLSIGPVQSLIGAARRTRDLWCGSWLLNEAAKAAAKVIHDAQPGSLIFPCPEDPEELNPSESTCNDANIANIIRAQIELEDQKLENQKKVLELINKAKQAAVNQIKELCNNAKQELNELPFHNNHWEAQINDILESFGAWVKIGDGPSAYADASARLGGLLAARKATRDFLPATEIADGPGFGTPKSSLDGARESVINLNHQDRNEKKYKTALRKLGISGGEELDALAVAKRMAGNTDQFTAYSRIAADSWIESLTKEQLKPVVASYEPLVISGLGGCRT